MTLQEWLKKNDLTVIEFSKMLGSSRQSVYNMIHGKRPLSIVANAVEIITRGEVKASELLALEPQKKHKVD